MHLILVLRKKPFKPFFYPSARCRPLRLRRRRVHSFGYHTNMQQIKFIIYTNIQPLPALFSPKVKVKDLKKFLLLKR